MPKLVSLDKELKPLGRLLADHLPWSPFDYVPGISLQGDRELAAEGLVAHKPAENDFRFRSESDKGEPIVLLAERLPWDSEFFGYGIARINGVFLLKAPLARTDLDYHRAFKELLERMQTSGIRYVTAQVDPHDLALLRALGEAGFTLLETRYFQYGRILEPVFGERLPVRRATEQDLPSLARAASQTINPYDRFHADPFIERAAVERLMERWIAESIAGNMADVTIVPDVPEPAAFMTFRYHRDKWSRWKLNVVQAVLSAVSPEHLGWLGWLRPEAHYHFHRLGAKFLCGSTQITNTTMMWLFQEEGCHFGKYQHIFRLVL